MERLEFKIDINAPKEKVWNVLWNDATYPQWTSVFTEGSRAESDWKEGSRIEFLDSKNDGMFSRIEKLSENEQMTFVHLGEILKGEEQPAKEEWKGAAESYFLSEKGGTTELRAELDSTSEFAEYFQGVFPKALEKVKEIAEKA